MSQQKHDDTILKISRDSIKAWPGTVLFEDGLRRPLRQATVTGRCTPSLENTTTRQTEWASPRLKRQIDSSKITDDFRRQRMNASRCYGSKKSGEHSLQQNGHIFTDSRPVFCNR